MVLTIIGAVLIFSIIIFVHELGHFIFAKLFNVNVMEFAIGMGPAIFKKQGKETLYSVRAIPMGGFCKMEGEDEDVKTEGSFSVKKPLPKIIILSAGAMMNVILGFIIATSLVATSAFQEGMLTSTIVQNVSPESPAAEFLQEGDQIVKINNSKINIKRDISFALSEAMNGGATEYEITVLRDSEEITKKLTPVEVKYDDGSTGYLVGFNVAPKKITLGGILRESFYQTVWMGKLVFVSLKLLLSGGASVSDMSGPIGVVSVMNTAAQSGLLDFLFLAAFLTVNIGIMNLLPLPALDGGRIIFALFELIFRRPVPPEKEGIVHAIGFFLLIALMIFVTWNDIIRLLGR